MMKIIVSNKLEILARRLADELSEPLDSALAKETIVIQSTGMQKWLSQELARYHGICANYDFPFPNAFIDDVFQAFIPDYAPDLSYDVNVLSWKIMEILPGIMQEENFLPVRNYLGDNYDQLKLFQLACKIAAAFDQYLIFRPEMILDWEEGKIKSPRETWQALLWQKIAAGQGRMHKARLRELFSAAAENKPQRQDAIPPRISIFGISYLPPYHLDIFYRVSGHIPVNIYYLNPSQEFWADIKSGREISLTLQRAPGGMEAFGDDFLHLESGNRLLASLGLVGRDFFRQISGLAAEYVELFEEPRQIDLLTAIQSDIYLLEDRGTDDKPRAEISAADESIQIHSCHSPLREVETLHNTLLALCEDDGGLMCRDILVMTPNIEKYAPCIEAVFESRLPKIPYSIADRSGFAGSTVAGGFFDLLDLAAGRFTSGEVLSLLENEAISEKFGLTGPAMELIRRWVESTNIKWGVDKKHRTEFGLPEFSQNTWEGGISSMLAGVALDGRRRELFAGIFPYGEIEGEQTEILGSFLDFWSALITTKNLLTGRKTPESWCAVLKKIIADFFPPAGDYSADLYKLREVVSRIARQMQFAGTETAVDLNVIKNCLARSSGSIVLSSRYLSGGVTFCEMLPLRSIPFDVICLIGMNNEAYPRKDNSVGFDLTQFKKRAGDRSLRAEDQYLFLEAILSARKNLVISYTGQDLQDNSTILPSALVSDLLDYIDQGFCGREGIAASAQISRQHHLHEFHPEYFREPKKLVSYSQENYLAALAFGARQKEVRGFVGAGLKDSPDPEKEISVDDLIDFYKSPVKYFLAKRLCLNIPRDMWETEDSEPFTINNLDAYKIKQELLERKIVDLDAGNVYAVSKSGGVLPVGAAGDYYFSSLKNMTQDFAAVVNSIIAGKKPEKISVDLMAGGMRITGAIDNVYENNLVHYRPAKLKTKDYIKMWISHLLFNFNGPSGMVRESILLGEGAGWRFGNVADAQLLLEGLIKYYIQGQARPLKLFPRSSWEYAKNIIQKQKSAPDALYSACVVWSGDGNGWTDGEAQEVANKICFADTMPLDAEFETTALEVLGPVFSHMEKQEL